MSEDIDETLKKDKLLVELMLHTYDEEVNRNELIDSKNSQMSFEYFYPKHSF